MDRGYRDDRLKAVNQKLLVGSALLDGLAREYTLGEIAIVTRAGPARLLGLKNKGDRKSTRLNSSHGYISYAVFCLKKKLRKPLLDSPDLLQHTLAQEQGAPQVFLV